LREKAKHIQAYEFYFQSGGLLIKEKKCKLGMARGSNWYRYVTGLSGRRSLLQVAKKMGVSRTAVNNWSNAFKWKERVEARDRKINKAVEIRLQKLAKRCP